MVRRAASSRDGGRSLHHETEVRADAALVQRARHGEPLAFEDLYRRYYRAVLAKCRASTSDRGEAEDAAQETFIRAWAAIGTFDEQKDLLPWLSVIARNTCIDLHRRVARQDPTEGQALQRLLPTAAIDGGVDAYDPDEILDTAYQSLPAHHREVLDLRERLNWSYEQIARHQSVGVPTVQTRLFRARRALRDRFNALRGEEGVAALFLFRLRSLRIGRLFDPSASTVPFGVKAVGAVALSVTATATVLGATAPSHAPTRPIAADIRAAVVPASTTGVQSPTPAGTTSPTAGHAAPEGSGSSSASTAGSTKGSGGASSGVGERSGLIEEPAVGTASSSTPIAAASSTPSPTTAPVTVTTAPATTNSTTPTSTTTSTNPTSSTPTSTTTTISVPQPATTIASSSATVSSATSSVGHAAAGVLGGGLRSVLSLLGVSGATGSTTPSATTNPTSSSSSPQTSSATTTTTLPVAASTNPLTGAQTGRTTTGDDPSPGPGAGDRPVSWPGTASSGSSDGGNPAPNGASRAATGALAGR